MGLILFKFNERSDKIYCFSAEVAHPKNTQVICVHTYLMPSYSKPTSKRVYVTNLEYAYKRVVYNETQVIRNSL